MIQLFGFDFHIRYLNDFIFIFSYFKYVLNKFKPPGLDCYPTRWRWMVGACGMPSTILFEFIKGGGGESIPQGSATGSRWVTSVGFAKSKIKSGSGFAIRFGARGNKTRCPEPWSVMNGQVETCGKEIFSGIYCRRIGVQPYPWLADIFSMYIFSRPHNLEILRHISSSLARK